jgi:hypothetical protein
MSPPGPAVSQCDTVGRSLSGDKRTSRGCRESVAADPSRHFTTINYCTAKGSFDHLVGSAEQGAEATIHREPSQS